MRVLNHQNVWYSFLNMVFQATTNKAFGRINIYLFSCQTFIRKYKITLMNKFLKVML